MMCGFVIIGFLPDGKQSYPGDGVQGGSSRTKYGRPMFPTKRQAPMMDALRLAWRERQVDVPSRLQTASKKSCGDAYDRGEQERRMRSNPFIRMYILVQQGARDVDVFVISEVAITS
jgi:hypothetical protein